MPLRLRRHLLPGSRWGVEVDHRATTCWSDESDLDSPLLLNLDSKDLHDRILPARMVHVVSLALGLDQSSYSSWFGTQLR